MFVPSVVGEDDKAQLTTDKWVEVTTVIGQQWMQAPIELRSKIKIKDTHYMGARGVIVIIVPKDLGS